MNTLMYEVLKSRKLIVHYQRIPASIAGSGLWTGTYEKFEEIPVFKNIKVKITFNNPAKKQYSALSNNRNQRVTVKAVFLSKSKYGAAFYTVFNKHLSYITRNGAAIIDNEKTKPELFTEPEKEFTSEELKNEKNIYKYVLSPENGDKLNMQKFTIDVMKRAQQELGHDLIWTAAIHNNTEHPHAHIVVRGVDRAGQEIIMPKKFQRQTLREIASREATIELGLRSDKEINEQEERETTQDRFTEIDKKIKSIALKQAGIDQKSVLKDYNKYQFEKTKVQKANYLNENDKFNLIQKLNANHNLALLNIEKINSFDKVNQKVTINDAALAARMDFLCKSGFAEQITKNDYILKASYETALKEHSISNDRIKNAHYKLDKVKLDKLPNGQKAQCFSQSKESCKIKAGQVIYKDLDEQTNRWNVLIKTKNNTYYQFEANNSNQLNHISENSFVVFTGNNIGRNKTELINDVQKTITHNNLTLYNQIVKDKTVIKPLTEQQIKLYKADIGRADAKNESLKNLVTQLKTDNFKAIKEKQHLGDDVQMYTHQYINKAKVIDKGMYQKNNFIVVEQEGKKYLVTDQKGEIQLGFNQVQKKFDFKTVEKNDLVDLSTYQKAVITRQYKEQER